MSNNNLADEQPYEKYEDDAKPDRIEWWKNLPVVPRVAVALVVVALICGCVWLLNLFAQSGSAAEEVSVAAETSTTAPVITTPDEPSADATVPATVTRGSEEEAEAGAPTAFDTSMLPLTPDDLAIALQSITTAMTTVTKPDWSQNGAMFATDVLDGFTGPAASYVPLTGDVVRGATSLIMVNSVSAPVTIGVSEFMVTTDRSTGTWLIASITTADGDTTGE